MQAFIWSHDSQQEHSDNCFMSNFYHSYSQQEEKLFYDVCNWHSGFTILVREPILGQRTFCSVAYRCEWHWMFGIFLSHTENYKLDFSVLKAIFSVADILQGNIKK